MRRSRMDPLLRTLIKLYPEAIRKEHGDEMMALLREERAFVSPSPRALWIFYARSIFDLTKGALRARRPKRWSPRPVRQRAGAEPFQAMLDAIRELGYAARSLGQAPLVSATIVLTLALAIGMNTAIFSVVHAVLLKPFAYEDPDELVYVGARWVEDEVKRGLHTGRDFALFQESLESFEEVAALTTIRQNLTGGELPRQVEVGWASRNFFHLLGVEAQLGPGFTPDTPEGTLVLSDHLYRDLFGGDAQILGRSLELDGRTYTVAGVMPRGFELHFPSLPEQVDVWKVPDDWWQNGDFWNASGVSFALLRVVGRLADNVTMVEAGHELAALANVMRENDAEQKRIGLELYAEPLRASVVGGVRPVLYLMLGAVALVLVIACANVTNLLLVRSHLRGPELSLRRALGATRVGIARLLLLDSALLAFAGGAAGIGLGVAGTRFLKSLRPEGLPRLEQVSLDTTVLAYALALALGATLGAGLLPAWRSLRDDARAMGSLRATAGARGQRLSGVIVVAQIGASVVLLIGAVLLTTSLARLSRVEPGFDAEQLLTFSVSLPGTSYERPEGTDRFLRSLESRVESLPGVQTAGVIWPVPLGSSRWLGQYVAGVVGDDTRAYAHYSVVTPGLFDTLRVPLMAGRGFSPADKRHVAIVSRNLAERAFPGRSAIGGTVRAEPWGGGLEAFEVIGVVDNIRYADLREAPPEAIYFDSRGWSWTDWELTVVARGPGASESLVPRIREELAGLDGSIPLSQVRMMRNYVEGQLASNRFAVSVIGLFAVVAASLALIGLYGVIAFTTSQRTREIGIRMALGAARRSILAWVLRRGAALTAAGIAVGLFAAWFMTHLVENLLFEVTSTDGFTFVVVATTLAGAALLASYLPARRATHVEPMRVLRAD